MHPRTTRAEGAGVPPRGVCGRSRRMGAGAPWAGTGQEIEAPARATSRGRQRIIGGGSDRDRLVPQMSRQDKQSRILASRNLGRGSRRGRSSGRAVHEAAVPSGVGPGPMPKAAVAAGQRNARRGAPSIQASRRPTGFAGPPRGRMARPQGGRLEPAGKRRRTCTRHLDSGAEVLCGRSDL